MKKGFLILTTLFYVALAVAQDGKLTLELDKFDELKAFDGISVRLIRSNTNKAVISGANTNKVAIVNNKGRLKIRMEIDKIFSGYRTFVDLYYSETLNIIDANEDARIYSDELIKQPVLDLRAQEGAEIELSCETEQVLIRAITGGDVYAMGSSRNQDVTINTGGSYLARQLRTEFTTISVNAGGNAEIFATNYVKADVKAGGNVKVFGNPKKIDKKTVFGGKIIVGD